MKLGYGAVILMATLVAVGVQADSVTHGGTTINMDFVDIGDGGVLGDPLAGGANVADSTGYGSVGYNYQMGKFEVTAAQWASVIVADSNVGNAGSYSGSQPTASSSWLEAAKFANWLTSGSYNNGAYQFSDPNMLTGVDRGAAVATYGTVYVLPTEDEWYKAAYLKSDGSDYTLYATGDTVPNVGVDAKYDDLFGSVWNVGTGLVENNGTFDMGGNVWEWTESAHDGTLNIMDETRAMRGGSYANPVGSLSSGQRGSFNPLHVGTDGLGFRVAAIPEPGVISLMAVFGGGLWFVRSYFPGG